MRGTDAELLALFAAWRAEIDAEPFAREDCFHAVLREWRPEPPAPRTSSPGEPPVRPVRPSAGAG